MFLVYIYVFIVGACVASFVNVVIDRLPKGISISKGRSRCDNCETQLKWYDLIPVVSWIMLRGRCRYCGSKIGLRTPLIELMGGSIALICFNRYFMSPVVLLNFSLFMVLLAITFIDIDTMTIPDELVISVGILAIISIFVSDVTMIDRIIGFFCVSLPMLGICFIKDGAFGGGDIKLTAVLGFFMGYKLLLVGMFIAIVLAGIWAIFLLVTHNIKLQEHMAFGPFICIGTFISELYGLTILIAYLSLFRLN
ncbi:prepilin peptidase [Kandleria vitulina]|uniref:prepilin peptidase n=1 Tax=Kandleria vitulina TaxID=1630 RepID=UPI000942283A|nr:A24 family peptidase [Kandleria vitulina]